MERLAFWKRIIAILGEIKLRPPQQIKSVEKAKDWLERSVFSSHKMLRSAIGDKDYANWHEMQMKIAQMSLRQQRIIDEYKQREM